MLDQPSRPDPSTSSDEAGNIKGVCLRPLVEWWELNRSTEKVRAAMQQVDAALVSDYLHPGRPALGILPSRWYPAILIHQVTDALLQDEDEASQWEIAEQVSDYIIDTTLRSAYRALLWLVGSPEIYAKHSQRFWRMHYDCGELIVKSSQRTEQHHHVRDWPSHHPFTCKANYMAAKPLYRIMGCHDVRVNQTACVSHGDAECIGVIRWR